LIEHVIGSILGSAVSIDVDGQGLSQPNGIRHLNVTKSTDIQTKLQGMQLAA
jgi:hypothetical protein